ncbi:RNA 2'-phosphotransferase [Rubripirellula amarantea]|uniref:RNA 2'-phosphotransferase n=1 Tax=Rubripirellula amarantea TaxID=2527999 RepID=A0A5C5WEM1_9BACT|nr:RNA 2'-phosphotransferase [Rubripirellula amarantea]MDA8744891.1 RNA 2'-phosphotransferase [Rubripirellula amarantea]TWT48192.1 RNA 2'-phosphotransferase [Rubripirellula amarantea]
MNKRLTRISKYLTYIMRHEPHSIGIKPDDEGYFVVTELVEKANASGKSVSVEQVLAVVEEHDKKLFSLSDDGNRIRINSVSSKS